MTVADLVVVGGGPAGAAVAWEAAAAGARVVLAHDGRAPWQPVGQQLAPAARAVLRRMGVDGRAAALARPVHGARSVWADPSAVDEASMLFNPYGPPWAVDRRVLDGLLRMAAREAGVRVVRARARAERAGGGGWRVAGLDDGPVPVPVVVDSTGASSAVSRGRLARRRADRLRCTVWRIPAAEAGPQPWSLVEAVPYGWWYTAPGPAPGGDLTVLQVQGAGGRAPCVPPPHTAARLRCPGPLPRPAAERVATVGRAAPPWAPGLVAAGDAALSVDPLSSSGLRHALELARPAAHAALGLVDGDEAAAAGYAELVAGAFARHLAERRAHHTAAAHYGREPFWRHRSTTGAGD
ncbi:tryptophan 7-halogenase [Streptomyces sp. NPDC048331]|uniref:tryptophan 7-halogenase n=1 Tax=Streptomyces sp. NPDC048331 TaxID=3365534 RepID=UPI0037207729